MLVAIHALRYGEKAMLQLLIGEYAEGRYPVRTWGIEKESAALILYIARPTLVREDYRCLVSLYHVSISQTILNSSCAVSILGIFCQRVAPDKYV